MCCSLNGVPLAYDSIKIVGQHGDIYDDQGFIHLNVEASFVIFKPKKESKLVVCFTCAVHDDKTVLEYFVMFVVVSLRVSLIKLEWVTWAVWSTAALMRVW